MRVIYDATVKQKIEFLAFGVGIIKKEFLQVLSISKNRERRERGDIS